MHTSFWDIVFDPQIIIGNCDMYFMAQWFSFRPSVVNCDSRKPVTEAWGKNKKLYYPLSENKDSDQLCIGKIRFSLDETQYIKLQSMKV